jgi:hypothetical protein
VTATALIDLPTPRRPLPQIFDRLVVILAIQADLFAAVLIAQSLPDYRSVPGCVALWLISSAVPLVCVVLARRTAGVLSARAFALAAGLLLFVDVAVPALVPPVDRAGTAVWNWGAVGVTILTFAVFRPSRDVLLLAGGHSIIAVATAATALGHPGARAFSLLVVANAAATPALAAAQYLSLYVRAVRLREQALIEHREIETRDAVRHAVREDAVSRLHALRADLVPFLTAIVDGRAEVGDPQVARSARRLAHELRRELAEARSGSWLLPVSPEAGERWPGVTLLDPRRLLGRLRDSDRAALIALLGMLRHHGEWQRVSVALAPGGEDAHGDDSPAAETPGRPSSAMLIVVAMGAPAEAASRDADVIAAASRLSMALETDLPAMLVAEAHLSLTPPSLMSLREEARSVPDFTTRQGNRGPLGTS